MPRTYGEMADAGEPMTEIFSIVLGLHQALKEAPVKDRVWRYTWTHAGREFALAVNGHLGQAVDGIPPLHIAIECNGWLALLCDMFQGTVVGIPESVLVDALDAALRSAQSVPAVGQSVESRQG